jgi:leucyl-tRNA synthetase
LKHEYGTDWLIDHRVGVQAVKPWQTAQVLGVVRFRDRVFNLVTGKPLSSTMDDETLRAMHKTIKKVLSSYSRPHRRINNSVSLNLYFANAGHERY